MKIQKRPLPTKAMTPEAQRIAIAEACGYAQFGTMDIGLGPTLTAMVCPNQRAMSVQEVPDYLNDLNAMHEAEQKLSPSVEHEMDGSDHAWNKYVDTLDFVCSKTGDTCVSGTASQRAEAFLKTLNLWTP